MIETPQRTDKMIAELRERASALGLVVTGRCRHCGRPIWAHSSIRDHTGPKCRAKYGEQESA